MARREFDLVILGGGSAGLSLAGITGHAGMKVALVEKARLGGECLHAGCVPSKALLAAARVVHRARCAPDLGLPDFEPGRIDLGRVMDRIARVVDVLEEQESPGKLRQWGVAEFIPGRARFAGSHEIVIEHEGGSRRVTADRVAICTGSQPVLPEIPGLAEAEPWTNENLFEQRTLPERLVVLGGGPIGCEMGQAFARLGSRVTILESSGRLLSRDEPEAGERLGEILRDEGLEIRLGTRATAVVRDGGTVRVRGEGPHGRVEIEGEALLAALGRRPAVRELRLEAAGVRYGDGGVVVDGGLRTTASHVWALGDVNGRHFFSHVAEYEARAVAGAILFGWPARVDYPLVPWTTFTDPEVAHVGLTEAKARERHGRVEVLRFPLERVDRAHAEGETDGFVKVIAVGLRGRIAGATLVAPAAGEIVQTWSLAVKQQLPVTRLSNLVHVYPTLSLAGQRAADAFYEQAGWARLAARLTRGWFRWRRRGETPWRDGP